MSWQQTKKLSFLSVIFSYSMQQQWAISQSDCDVWWKVDFIWQLVMTSSVVGPRRSSKALPKAKLGLPKNGLNNCLVVCCLSDPLQLSKTWWNHYIWEVCSANQWDTLKTTGLATGTDQQKGPNSSPWQCLTAHHTTSASKVELIGLQSSASFTVDLTSHQLTITSSSISTSLCRENTSTTNRMQNAFQESVKSWSTDCYYRNK